MPSFARSVRDKWHGLSRSFAFSNWLELLLVRGLSPRRHIVVYEWQSRFSITCDTRVLDHHSPKEALAEAAYDLYLRHCLVDGKCSYVNIGANVGAFDVAVAAQGSVPRALSVEMNPRTYHRLCFNLQANDFNAVKTLNCGVAGEAGEYAVTLGLCSLSDNLWSNPTDGAADRVMVPVKTLDQALTETDFSRQEFDLLKLDCEGAEYGIVRQSSPETLRSFRHLVMELHPPPPGDSAEAMRAKLSAVGFVERKLQGEPPPAENLFFWERTEPAP